MVPRAGGTVLVITERAGRILVPDETLCCRRNAGLLRVLLSPPEEETVPRDPVEVVFGREWYGRCCPDLRRIRDQCCRRARRGNSFRVFLPARDHREHVASTEIVGVRHLFGASHCEPLRQPAPNENWGLQVGWHYILVPHIVLDRPHSFH